MYELSGIGGSIGLSPHPQHWHRFIKNYGTQMRTCPPGMGCPQSEIWEPWWFYYVSTNRLFTLYLANSLTMASNYREMGVHQKIFTPANKDFDFVSQWDQQWKAEKLPQTIPRLNRDLGIVSELLQASLKIHDKHNIVIITLLTSENVSKNFTPYSHLDFREKKQMIERTLFIVRNPDIIGQSLQNMIVDAPELLSNQREEHLLRSIFNLTRCGLKVLSIPSTWKGEAKKNLMTLLDGKEPIGICCKENKKRILLAGKVDGQKTPHSEFMLFNGQEESIFRFLEKWKMKIETTKRFIPFKSFWLQSMQNDNNLCWDWILN